VYEFCDGLDEQIKFEFEDRHENYVEIDKIVASHSTNDSENIVIANENEIINQPSQPNDINNVAQEESVLSREDDDGCLQSYEDH
ncbi:hypothetical protein Taro_051805, partial [Colocasia esculenta]|nr:hypothetical protein [Colocasia esculenta]